VKALELLLTNDRTRPLTCIDQTGNCHCPTETERYVSNRQQVTRALLCDKVVVQFGNGGALASVCDSSWTGSVSSLFELQTT